MNKIEYNKKYRKEHKEERKIYWNNYARTHKKQIKKRLNERKEEIKQYQKIYRQNHKKELNEYAKKYINKRSKIDINYKLKNYLRKRIWDALKGICKSTHTEELLGCNIEFLKQHLERQFKSGMSWTNYGKNGWEVDHILPCAFFDLSKPEEQLKCFNYKNLQPLWYLDNKLKSDKIMAC